MTQPHTIGLPSAQARPQPPAPVRHAALFMYAGAALSLAGGILTLLGTAALRASVRHAYPKYTPTQVSGLVSGEIVYSVMFSIVVIFLWLLLSWACRAGKPWGRILGTVLFGLNSVLLAGTVITRALAGSPPQLSAGSLVTGLAWAAGLGAVVMLWQRAARAYFTAS